MSSQAKVSSDSEDAASPPKKTKTLHCTSSSSESDIEDYLQKPADLKLNSTFFKSNTNSTKTNEEHVVHANLTDSDSDEPLSSYTKQENSHQAVNSTSEPFEEMTKQARELEETKKQVEAYLAKRQKENHDIQVDDLLALGEKPFNLRRDLAEVGFHASDFESDNEDWEEVEESQEQNIIPKEGVEIVVEMPGVVAKKKKRIDLMAALKRRMNRIRKENQVYVHKVHLLCWIAHGNHVNAILNEDHLMALALSLIPSTECYPPTRTNLNYLERITTWYHKSVKLQPEEANDDFRKRDLNQIISKHIESKIATSPEILVYIFVTMLRSLGMQCRLVLSLQVEPLRPPGNDLYSLKNEKCTKDANVISKPKNAKKTKTQTSDKHETQTTRKKNEHSSKLNLKKLKSKDVPSTSSSRKVVESKTTKAQSRNKPNNTESTKRVTRSKVSAVSESIDKRVDELEALERVSPKKTNISTSTRSLRQRIPSKKAKKVPQVDGQYDSDDDDDDKKTSRKSRINIQALKSSPAASSSCKNDIVKLVKSSIRQEKQKTMKSDSDSDFMPELPTRKTCNDKMVKKRIPPRSQLEKKSKENEEHSPKKGIDAWVEVFLEEEEKWISANVVTGKVHCIKDIYTQASHPASYILAWDNSNRIKDVSQRYCPNWNTVTRKQRVDAKWWAESLRGFIGQQSARDMEEDEDLARQQLDQPLPKTISEFKDHPLYVLKRHLLKFQAIYPPDAPTLGFIRNEPVFSRSCVYILHSRDIWLKHAKVVKAGEQPYKIVKARPKYDKLSNTMITDQLLEIFGVWQVQDYDPPTAENGVVPRNAYGNVEFFKPCMLPKKCIHLQLPGLNKIARKLNIDCAPAVVGFDFHAGWNHAVYDGFIVCEEFGDQLIKAWEQEQEEIVKREQDKYEKRVFGNWRRLIKAALIRARLQSRYDFTSDCNRTEEEDKVPKKRPKFMKRK